MSDYKNKVVLITGGSSGIGLSCAKKFYKKGATVVILGRNETRLEKAKEEILSVSKEKSEEKIVTLACDIAKVSECERGIQETINRCGRLDVLVNSAGVYFEGHTVDMTEEIWNETLDINLKGTFFMIKYAIPYLERTAGNIINVSSDAGVVGNTQAAIYCASKGGMNIMTKSLALELAPKRIRVNAVCPCVVNTPMLEKDFEQSGFENREMYDKYSLAVYPQGQHARYAHPEEIAETIYFLSKTNKIEAITGTCISVDFGITAGY